MGKEVRLEGISISFVTHKLKKKKKITRKTQCHKSYATVCNHNRKTQEFHHPRSGGSFRLG